MGLKWILRPSGYHGDGSVSELLAFKWPEPKFQCPQTDKLYQTKRAHVLDSTPAHVHVCKRLRLELMTEELVLTPSTSQAPGSRDMLGVTCVIVGVRCVLRGAGDCTMNMMFSATASKLSTSAPLKRSAATMAAIMRKSSTPLHKRRV